MNSVLSAALCLTVSLYPTAATSTDAPQPSLYCAQGLMFGEAASDQVLVQTRLTAVPGPETDADGDVPGAEGTVVFEYSLSDTFRPAQRTPSIRASRESDFIARTRLEGLQPATRYFVRALIGSTEGDLHPAAAGSFRTLPTSSSAEEVTFCMGSCMHYHAFMSGRSNGGGPVTATETDKREGYPVFAAMADLQPDFFIGTGDIVYYDHPQNQAAATLPELRKKWHEQFRFPRLIHFFSRTAAYWSKDDHDFRFNDADLTGRKLPAPATGISVFREQLPVRDSGDEDRPMYRTHRVNRALQIWFVEGRDHRSPNRMPDGPEKSIWGREQKAWLLQTLAESDAAWKVIVSPTPMVGPDRDSKIDNHANTRGFRHEADSFFAWLQENGIRNVVTFCGDRHWQYHSIHPGGVQEFCCGALNDENSIRGIGPGNPKSTDPDGQVKQPYRYTEPTGGFLHVTAGGDNDVLHVRFRDDHGRLLYEYSAAGDTSGAE